VTSAVLELRFSGKRVDQALLPLHGFPVPATCQSVYFAVPFLPKRWLVLRGTCGAWPCDSLYFGDYRGQGLLEIAVAVVF
jgi:hypothetical protein